jgi:hypothetical protein
MGCGLLGNKVVSLHPINDTHFYIRDGGETDGDICFSEWYYKHKLMPEINPDIIYEGE